MADYIPAADYEFQSWANNLLGYANDHLVELGLTASDVSDLLAMQTDFDDRITAHSAARTAAQSARQAKDDSRDAFKSAIRQFVRGLQASPDVDDAERAGLGITVMEKTHARDASALMTRPVGMAGTAQRLQHEIRFYNEATPTRRAKPAGVMGCEIWVKLTASGEPAPVSADELSFVTLATATPYVAKYDGIDGGRMAHYMLRWVNGSNRGPWSETISATITA